ncbi:MAG: aminomethyl-transferring glycine dehydrogenase [Rhodospirillaceae bacterium]|nr:aminomethyl-transferring glycine dehydrogenase [Rhodospirillaceae bacterium]
MSGKRQRYAELTSDRDFIARHIGPRDSDLAEMLEVVGASSIDDLIDRTVPKGIRSDAPLNLGSPMSETSVLEELRLKASQNKVATSLIGTGYHGTHLPGVIQRNILENPGWYTAYTPYQPEISQGRLEALLNFQTMVTDLTAMDIANASMLDEGTAAAEAMSVCRKAAKNKGGTFFVSEGCHPQTIDIIHTRAAPIGISVVVGDESQGLPEDAFGCLLQYPSTTGEITDYHDLIEAAHAAGTMVVMAADILALTLLVPPGELGADIAVGSTQRFGVPMGFGGPHAAYFATRDAHKRAMPGRLVGVSLDTEGKPAYRLALQAREQHIRREKATSNICTAQVLLAVIASMYAVYHGPQGLSRIARRVHRLTVILAEGLRRMGWKLEKHAYFDTIIVKTDDWTGSVMEGARVEGYNLRLMGDRVGITLDETSDRKLIQWLWAIMAFDSLELLDFDQIDAEIDDTMPASLLRQSEFLTHPVFHEHRSETEMMRYLRRLADKDIALDRSMIPLGSCTMKLNATTEMAAITWPEFADIHPFAPKSQAEGYLELITELEAMLCEVTGYAAVSLQPNAGSQGEYAGLLAIKAYHESRGEGSRDVCLIPASAHGTNPASAAMAGMRVVLVACDDAGNIDLDSLNAKAEEHSDSLAAIMVTYPSTHGVFEEAITEVCRIVHDHGGQVYMDGANLNAMVGLCLPGQFGSDVSHLNLHKTFCIPHGGGGPGVGPIGVGAHLAPFLPDHRHMNGNTGESSSGGAVAAAPWGSAGILPISWAYMKLMGADGLKRATEIAILNANYIAKRLEPHYPVLYTGTEGFVAHECILDLRPIKEATEITVDDVVKRLMDYGFHAPTMSFPVPGTLMVEPTESESKFELDRFCQAMIDIREEIAAVERGEVPAEATALRAAPHTSAVVTAENWQRAYSRDQAAFPSEHQRTDKYWPPVARIDNAYGDRNLICTCPPIEAYEDAAD